MRSSRSWSWNPAGLPRQRLSTGSGVAAAAEVAGAAEAAARKVMVVTCRARQVTGFQQCPLSVVGSPFRSLGSLSGFSGSPGGFFGGFGHFLSSGFTLLACTLQQLVEAGIAIASSANDVTTLSRRGRTSVTLSAGRP